MSELELVDGAPVRLDARGGLARVAARVVRGALLRPQGHVSGDTLPRLRASWDGVVVPRPRVAAYREVCGIPGDPDVLPLPMPEILFLRLLAGIATDRRFPLSPFGLIHVRQTLAGRAPVRAGVPLALRAEVSRASRGPKGIEVDVGLRVIVSGDDVWGATATLLSRAAEVRGGGGRGARPEARPVSGVDLPVLEDTGRRYAHVSGDANPHHLWALTARPLGYPRPIAHGMWELARLIGQLPADVDTTVGRAEVTFKVPLAMPGVLRARVVPDGARWRLDAFHPTSGAPFVDGWFDPRA